MSKPVLSVCMIVRDEEEILPLCLESVRELADELIVVDTGSTDRTKEIADSFAARVIDFSWKDDFSAARNVSLEAASGKWILQIDADEELVIEDAPKLKTLLSDKTHTGFLLQIVNLSGEDQKQSVPWSTPSLRLFRNYKRHRYLGVVHEQIQLPGAQATGIGFAEVRLRHYGYLRPRLDEREKGRRNMELVRQALKRKPNDPFNLYILGNEHMAAGEYNSAMQAYGKAYSIIKTPLPLYFPKLLRNLVSCLRELGRWQESVEAAEIAQRDFDDYTDLEFLKGLSLLEHNQIDEAVKAFGRCLELGEAPPLYDTQQGVGGWRAHLGLGIAYSQMGDDDRAVEHLTATLSENPGEALAAGHLAAVFARRYGVEETRARLATLADLAAPGVSEAVEQAIARTPLMP